MSSKVAMPVIYYDDSRAQAVFAEAGPQPRFLIDSERFRVVVVGLEPGQEIPAHADGLAMYHVLEGKGAIQIDEEPYRLAPGVTAIAPAGAARGIVAASRLILLGAKVS